jgi:uncharacterized membrane protein YfcA
VWTYKKAILIGGISFLAGILAALLGIGGGLIVSPIMVICFINTSIHTITIRTNTYYKDAQLIANIYIFDLFASIIYVSWKWGHCLTSPQQRRVL